MIKTINYGNGRKLTMGYNANRQQPVSMKVDMANNPNDKIIDYAMLAQRLEENVFAAVLGRAQRPIVRSSDHRMGEIGRAKPPAHNFLLD